MASQPPAGYNPEASLLQGGTATIHPVQGGGGMEAGAAPAGYNPGVSLLNTGNNAPILAVRLFESDSYLIVAVRLGDSGCRVSILG